MDAQERRKLVYLYTGAVFLFWASLYLYVPTLPLYIQTKTDTLAMIGVVVSMYGLWQGLLRLPLGIATDWLGRRKPFVLVCFGFSILGAWMMSSTSDVNGLVIGRGITGLAAAGWVPLVVMFSALFPAEDAVRATAILSMVNAISRMCATAVTGFLNDMGGYRLAFYVAMLVAGAAIFVILPAREVRRDPKPFSMQSLGRLILRGDVLLPSFLGAVNHYAVFATCYSFFPIVAKNLGADNLMQGAMATLTLAAITLGSLITTGMIKRLGSGRVILLSFFVASTGIVTGALATSLWMVFAAQILVGLASGICYPVLMGMSIQQVEEAERATAMGVYQSVYAFGMFGGPWLSGILADAMGIESMLLMTAVFILILGTGGTVLLSRAFPKASQL